MHAMTGDEQAALNWLLGRDKPHVETVYTSKGDKIEQEISIARGHAALIRLFEKHRISSPDLWDALASALRPAGVSEMKWTLELKRRKGRGRPRNDVKEAYEAVTLAKRVDAGIAAGEKQEARLAEEPGSRAKKLSQLKRVRRARQAAIPEK